MIWCRETRNRIRVAIAAYAYEVEADPIMSDAEYDALSRQIDPRKPTCNLRLDQFFRQHFSAHTGSWIHQHPDLAGVRRLYLMVREGDPPGRSANSV